MHFLDVSAISVNTRRNWTGFFVQKQSVGHWDEPFWGVLSTPILVCPWGAKQKVQIGHFCTLIDCLVTFWNAHFYHRSRPRTTTNYTILERQWTPHLCIPNLKSLPLILSELQVDELDTFSNTLSRNFCLKFCNNSVNIVPKPTYYIPIESSLNFQSNQTNRSSLTRAVCKL